jgi:hypothetical protein
MLKRHARRPGVVSVSQDGETIVLDPARGSYHILNEVGTRVWELIGQELGPDAIVAALLTEYEVPAATGADHVRHDVLAILTQLSVAGVIEPGSLDT